MPPQVQARQWQSTGRLFGSSFSCYLAPSDQSRSSGQCWSGHLSLKSCSVVSSTTPMEDSYRSLWLGVEHSSQLQLWGAKKKWGQQKNETSKTALFCRSARILKAVEFRCTTFVERKRFGRMWRKCENKIGYVENFALFDYLLLCFKNPDKIFRLFKK